MPKNEFAKTGEGTLVANCVGNCFAVCVGEVGR